MSTALLKLKSQYKDPIIMRYFQDLTIKEIAIILNLTENTVKTRLRRGLNQLKTLIERSDVYE